MERTKTDFSQQRIKSESLKRSYPRRNKTCFFLEAVTCIFREDLKPICTFYCPFATQPLQGEPSALFLQHKSSSWPNLPSQKQLWGQMGKPDIGKLAFPGGCRPRALSGGSLPISFPGAGGRRGEDAKAGAEVQRLLGSEESWGETHPPSPQHGQEETPPPPPRRLLLQRGW